MNLNHIWKGGLSGLLSTLLISVVMIIKKNIGFSTQFNPVEVLSNSLNLHFVSYGWYLHYFLGVMFGIIFSVIYYHIPGESRFRGFIFGAGIWLIMMITVMPLSGMGFFAMNIGSNVAMYTFVIHIIYGIFLGIIYGYLDKKMS